MQINVDKSSRKIQIHSTWFFNDVVNVRLTKHGRIHKVFHITDNENLLKQTIWRSTLVMLLFNLMNQSNNNMI